MEAQSASLWWRGAIFLGSGIIALGLFFGLRSRSDAPPTSPPVPVVETQPVPVQPAALQPAPAVPASSVDRSAVEKQVTAALATHKKNLTDKCLTPALAKQPEPKIVKYVFNFTFDASGKQLTRGASEMRRFGRPDVTECVLAALPEISVPAPGQNVFVEVPFELP